MTARAEPVAPTFEKRLAGRKILIVVENLPVPFDRRVWQESLALRAPDAEVSVICPERQGIRSGGDDRRRSHLSSQLPLEGDSARRHIFANIRARSSTNAACFQGPARTGVFGHSGLQSARPDLHGGAALQASGREFVFDHHDISPELYEVKFGSAASAGALLVYFERMSPSSRTWSSDQ